jgi:hypothetical protein
MHFFLVGIYGIIAAREVAYAKKKSIRYCTFRGGAERAN